MVKVLFVDDEPDIELLTKQKFRKQMANGAFDLLFARNGQEALDLIKKEPDIAVVVSDLNMPGMDGLTLLDKLKEFSPSPKTIVVSAYGDIKSLRSAMNKGVFDFVTKPVDFNELGETILQALKQDEGFPSLLSIYQHELTQGFPEGVTLRNSSRKPIILWDSFPLCSSSWIIVLGVFVLPSPLPLELATSAVHGLLKGSLYENSDLFLTSFEERLYKVNKSLKAHVLVGQYHGGSHVFSYKTNGEFRVYHMTSEEKILLTSSSTELLTLGNAVILEHPSALSHLALSPIHED